MKLLHILLTAGLMLSAVHATAQDAYKLQLRATSLQTNDVGDIVKRTVTHETLVRQCAEEHGITNRSTLRALTLVYRVNGDLNGDTIEVVDTSTGDIVCTEVKLLHQLWGATLPSPDGSGEHTFSGVFPEGGGEPIGTAVIRKRFSPNGKTHISGSFNFLQPAEGGGAGVEIVQGTFNASRLVN